MAGLMSRTMTIIKAKYSKLLNRAENPAETLDYSYEEQLRQLQNVKRGIADVATAKKRLEIQYTSMQQQVDKLDGQAKSALHGGPRGSRARGAHAQGGGPGAARRDHAAGPAARGPAAEARRRREAARRRRSSSSARRRRVIKAQYSAAEAQVRIGEAATGISSQMSDVGAAVQRAKDKTLDMQARADAIDELTQAGALEDFTSTGDDIDRQLARDPADGPGRLGAREAQGRARSGIDAEGARGARTPPAAARRRDRRPAAEEQQQAQAPEA